MTLQCREVDAVEERRQLWVARHPLVEPVDNRRDSGAAADGVIVTLLGWFVDSVLAHLVPSSRWWWCAAGLG